MSGTYDTNFLPLFNFNNQLSSHFLNVSGYFKSAGSLPVENVQLILRDGNNNVTYSMDILHTKSDQIEYLERKTLARFLMPISLYDEGKSILLALKYKTNSVKFYYSVMMTTYLESTVIIEKETYYFNVHFAATVVYYEDVIFYGRVTIAKNVKVTFKKSVTFYFSFAFDGEMIPEGSLIQSQFSTEFNEERQYITRKFPVNYFQIFNSMNLLRLVESAKVSISRKAECICEYPKTSLCIVSAMPD